MKRLIRIELHKILYNRTVWVMLGLYVILFLLAALIVDGFVNSGQLSSGSNHSPGSMLLSRLTIFNYPDIWHNMAYMAGLFKILLAVIVITLVVNEYNYRTLRQNIIDGMSKWEVIWAKELVILLLSVMAFVVLIITTLLFGKGVDGSNMFDGIEFALAYFVSLLLYLNMAYLLSTWIRKSGLVMAILIGYSLIIENVITYYLPEAISDFLPMNVMGHMIPNPFRQLIGLDISQNFLLMNIGICFLYAAAFIGLNHMMLKKGAANK